MENKDLDLKLKNHLLETVGEKPSEREMEQIEKEIERCYDKIYDEYDKDENFIAEVYTKELSKYWVSVVANESLTQEYLSIKDYANPEPDYSIASFASGLSVFELFLARELVPKGFVKCIDISEGMNKIAKEYVDKLRVQNIEIINSSVLETPLKDNSQDIVIARRTGLSKDKRWIRVLQEAFRVLKKKESSTFIYTVDKGYEDPLEKIKSDFEKANLRFLGIKISHSSNNGEVYMIAAKPIIENKG